MNDQDDSRNMPTDPAPPMLEEDDFPNGPDPEPKTGRHNERPPFLGTPPPEQIPGAEPVPHHVLATVIRDVLKEALSPIETKIDDLKEIGTTTASGVVDLNTRVAQIAEDRRKDRLDIDRILDHLGLAAQ